MLPGRCMEAYSKARTADAITALGLLRPAHALLVTPVLAASGGSEISTPSHEGDLEIGKSELDGGVLAARPGFKITKIDAKLLEIGDIIRVPTGATPAADATIVSGEDTAFDESSLTGESKLVQKTMGDQILLGTINRLKMVDAQVSAHGGASM